VWDTKEYFDAINLEAIPREKNIFADELVVVASTMQLSNKLIKDKTKMDIIFKPSIPDKSEHGQAFDNETHVIHFLINLDKFSELDFGTIRHALAMKIGGEAKAHEKAKNVWWNSTRIVFY